MTSMKNAPAPRLANGIQAIGNTPIVPLQRIGRETNSKIYAKLEYRNPTASYKDRMALAMIEGAEARGDISPGETTIVEYTGGSTGSSLAFICAVKGYKLKIVTSDAFSDEKTRTMASLGAEVLLEPSVNGAVTPDLMPRIIERARRLSLEKGTFWTDQFNNKDNMRGQRVMGAEILSQTEGSVDAFVVSVGTGGCAMGVSSVLKEYNKTIKTIVVEPSTSAVISGGPAGSHRIEGIALGFVPPLLDKGLYDDVAVIDEAEARVMARRLAREEGIFAGTSSGANVLAAVNLAKATSVPMNIVVPIVDSGLRYVSTDLFPRTY